MVLVLALVFPLYSYSTLNNSLMLLLFIFQFSDKQGDIYDILWAVVFGFATLNIVGLALRRFESDGFGICLKCEEDISPKRINAVPWTPYCIACQEAADRAFCVG